MELLTNGKYKKSYRYSIFILVFDEMTHGYRKRLFGNLRFCASIFSKCALEVQSNEMNHPIEYKEVDTPKEICY